MQSSTGEVSAAPAAAPTDIRNYNAYLVTLAHGRPATINRRLDSLRKLFVPLQKDVRNAIEMYLEIQPKMPMRRLLIGRRGEDLVTSAKLLGHEGIKANAVNTRPSQADLEHAVEKPAVGQK